jgi:hypothetical protein
MQQNVLATLNYTADGGTPPEVYFYEPPLGTLVRPPGDDPREMQILDGWSRATTFSLDREGFELREFKPALELANSLRRNDALLPILWGLWVSMLCTGRIAESLHWVTQTLGDAEEYHDPNLLLVGHTAALINNFRLGELAKVREHTD